MHADIPVPVLHIPAWEEGGPVGLPNLLKEEEKEEDEEEKKEEEAKIYYFPKKENSLGRANTLKLAWDMIPSIHCLLLPQNS